MRALGKRPQSEDYEENEQLHLMWELTRHDVNEIIALIRWVELKLWLLRLGLCESYLCVFAYVIVLFTEKKPKNVIWSKLNHAAAEVPSCPVAWGWFLVGAGMSWTRPIWCSRLHENVFFLQFKSKTIIFSRFMTHNMRYFKRKRRDTRLSKQPGLPWHLSGAAGWLPPCHAALMQ